MCPAKRRRSSRKRSQTLQWVTLAGILILVIVFSAVIISTLSKTNQTSTDPDFVAFTNHYLPIMKNLNSSQTRTQMAGLLNPALNQTDLFTWEKSKMTFVNPSVFYEDPFQILNYGKGICVQWSILYVAACLANDYPSRLVVAVDTSRWAFIHTWAEDYYNGTWVHVDPSDAVWNDPSRYQSWGWGTFGSQVKVYAFEDGSYKEVTSTYAPQKS